MNQDSIESKIRDTLLDFDPIFAFGNRKFQGSEYDLEIPEILSSLLHADDYRKLRCELQKIFRRRVGLFEAGTKFRYTKLAKKIIGNKEGMIEG
jgi:hypothetical protein